VKFGGQTQSVPPGPDRPCRVPSPVRPDGSGPAPPTAEGARPAGRNGLTMAATASRATERPHDPRRNRRIQTPAGRRPVPVPRHRAAAFARARLQRLQPDPEGAGGPAPGHSRQEKLAWDDPGKAGVTLEIDVPVWHESESRRTRPRSKHLLR